MLKENNTHTCDMRWIFSFLYESYQSLEKDLENNNKTCNVSSSYYMLTSTNNGDAMARILSVSAADIQQHEHLKSYTISAMSNQYAIRQNIEHAVFERFKSIQIRQRFSSPLRFPAKNRRRHNKNLLYTWRNWKNIIQLTRVFHENLICEQIIKQFHFIVVQTQKSNFFITRKSSFSTLYQNTSSLHICKPERHIQ